MKAEHTIAIVAVAFAVLGLVLLSNVQPEQAVLSNAAVIGFVVAENQESTGMLADINRFFTSGRLPGEIRDKYLPIYILVNIVFITTVVIAFHKTKKR